MAKNKGILGIDVGGTSIKFGLVNHQGQLKKFGQALTPKTGAGIIKLLIKLINDNRQLADKAGLGLPGRLNLKQGKILQTSNLALANTPIAKILKQKTGLAIKIDNDANCFALAEAIIGAGKKYQYVVGLTLGTGIGGGIVINKKIYHGANNAGELGHQFIDFKQAKDLEDYLGAKKLKLTPADYQRLEKQAKAKNKKALRFWDELGNKLGFGCLNIINILSPEIIVLGGKQALAFNLFYPSLRATVKKYCLAKPPKIVKSQLIDKAGLIGASLLFKN